MKRTSFSPKGEGAPAPLQDAGHPSIKIIASLTGSDRLLDLILQIPAIWSSCSTRTEREHTTAPRTAKYRAIRTPSAAGRIRSPKSTRKTGRQQETLPADRPHRKGKRAVFRFLLPDGSVKHIESRGYIIRDAKVTSAMSWSFPGTSPPTRIPEWSSRRHGGHVPQARREFICRRFRHPGTGDSVREPAHMRNHGLRRAASLPRA